MCNVVDKKTWQQKKVEQNELPRISAVYAQAHQFLTSPNWGLYCDILVMDAERISC